MASKSPTIYAGTLLLALSLTAFMHGASLFSTTACYAVYDPSIDLWGGTVFDLQVCDLGDCTSSCVADSRVWGSSGTGWRVDVWCECGGAQNGSDDNSGCHAVVTYLGEGSDEDWLKLDIDNWACVNSCEGGDACEQLPPPYPRQSYQSGDRLCGCE